MKTQNEIEFYDSRIKDNFSNTSNDYDCNYKSIFARIAP